MAISEKVCWDVLNKIKGRSATFNRGQANSHTIENAMPLYDIERDLVLRHSKSEIEDSLYFLEKRGYLIKHGFVNFTLVAYELSEQALKVLTDNKFTDEEQQTFKEALFDVKNPGWFGMKFNLGEAFRRLKKRVIEN